MKDKMLIILLFVIVILLVDSMLFAFKTPDEEIVGVTILLLIGFLCGCFYEFFRKKKFYDHLVHCVEHLDKKYLVSEMIYYPNFYEGTILYDCLYEINKSMNERVKEYSINLTNFKEYIEMWIHEVKLPIASINLIIHNNKQLINKKIIEQLKRLEDNVEQVLYYVRSEYSEKDYLIKEVNISKVISNVALKNKDMLLEENIQLIVEDCNTYVLTDSKWLEFIINQIVSNSMKYIKDNTESMIKITAVKNENNTVLSIYDNGIGIAKKDISKVFHKTFTGTNGRKIRTSTGMGLYIAKKLCNKLGHIITIESEENEYTNVNIIFMRNQFFDVVK